MNHPQNSGFTLIELMIVILIVGILAQLAIPIYRQASDDAKYTQIEVQMNAINKALQAFYAEHGGYPPDVYGDEEPPGLVPQFLDVWPKAADDQFGAQFDYEAWPIGDGYWIGVTYTGRNKVRDSGLYGGCFFVQNGIDGIPIRYEDDIGIQVASNAKIVEDVVDTTHYRRIGRGVYRTR